MALRGERGIDAVVVSFVVCFEALLGVVSDGLPPGLRGGVQGDDEGAWLSVFVFCLRDARKKGARVELTPEGNIFAFFVADPGACFLPLLGFPSPSGELISSLSEGGE